MPKMSWSSGAGSVLRKSTRVRESRNALNAASAGAVSRSAGITGRASFLRRLKMACTSSCYHTPAPARPRNTAADLMDANCFSISGCHGMPGCNSHSSNQGRNPLSISICATFLTSGLSLLLWQGRHRTRFPEATQELAEGPSIPSMPLMHQPCRWRHRCDQNR